MLAGSAVLAMATIRRGFCWIVAITAALPAAWGTLRIAAFILGDSAAGYLTGLTMMTMTLLTLAYVEAAEGVPSVDTETVAVDSRAAPEKENA